MAGKSRARLTDASIARLRPREREYTVWDLRLPGLGVRVRTTGARTFVLLRDAGGRSRRVSLGPVGARTVEEIRRKAHAVAAASPPNGPHGRNGTRRTAPLFRDFVEGPWKEAHFDRYKPSTKEGARYTLRNRLLPTFGPKPLDRISLVDVRRWFDTYSRTSPSGANRGLDLFRQIMNFAVSRGLLDTNPARNIKHNPRPRLTRFLSREEIARLHRALDDHAETKARPQADMIRLLLLTGCRILLTGCRRSEIVRLRWSEVHDTTLMLADSKTGPRRVPLNSQARCILERQPQEGSPFVFPSPRDPARPRGREIRLWYRVRREAGVEDCRLHDLRHTYASHAVMNGVPVPVVSRLLGHSNVRMTLRYAHLGDREIEAVAERVGQAIGAIMDI